MPFDAKRMLAKCYRDQWSIHDLDWSLAPPSMPAPKERAIVQYFTDMAEIERLAGALFAEQCRRSDDPIMKEIFRSFVTDELRHADVASRLAEYYDVHAYQIYRPNPHLTRFAPALLEAIRHVRAEIANTYITTGEVLLDVALLRSLNDYVDDRMSQAAIDRINRDESRHIAVDFHMVEMYCSDAYLAKAEAEPAPPLARRLKSALALAKMLWFAGPFIRDVFFRPMDLTDPGGTRMREAFKRLQLVAQRPEVARRPFTRFFHTVRGLYQSPLGRRIGPLLERISGLDGRALVNLYSDEDARHANAGTIQEIADDILGIKFASATS